MVRMLVVEDDVDTNAYFCAVLRAEGYEADAVFDGEAALAALDACRYDVLVVDVMMPRMDGYELTDTLRTCGYDLPILMVTAREDPRDIRRGFLVGTDDYLVKPVDPEEMVLRCKALMRRARIVSDRRIVMGDVVCDYDALSVTRAGQPPVTLPPKEFYLLYKLLAYPGQVFTRLQLMDEVWGLDSDSDFATVNVHVNRLRTRFEGWPEFQIQTVRGIGYRAVRSA